MATRRSLMGTSWPSFVACMVLALALNCALTLIPTLLFSGSAHARTCLVLLLPMFSLIVLAEALAQRCWSFTSAIVTQKEEHHLALATGLALLFVLWVAQVERLLVDTTVHLILLVIGAVLMPIGGALRCTAIRTLGRGFRTEVVVTLEDGLVTSGVYRYVRHPSEAGTLSIALGICLICHSAWAFAWLLAVLLPLVLYRIRLEDDLLHTEFGEEFVHYSGHVRRLIPILY